MVGLWWGFLTEASAAHAESSRAYGGVQLALVGALDRAE
jgi:hypothetical protein